MISLKNSSSILGTLLICALLAACGDEGNGQQAGGAPGMGAGMPALKSLRQNRCCNVTEWDEFTGRFEATDTAEVRARVQATSAPSASRTAQWSKKTTFCS